MPFKEAVKVWEETIQTDNIIRNLRHFYLGTITQIKQEIERIVIPYSNLAEQLNIGVAGNMYFYVNLVKSLSFEINKIYFNGSMYGLVYPIRFATGVNIAFTLNGNMAGLFFDKPYGFHLLDGGITIKKFSNFICTGDGNLFNDLGIDFNSDVNKITEVLPKLLSTINLDSIGIVKIEENNIYYPYFVTQVTKNKKIVEMLKDELITNILSINK